MVVYRLLQALKEAKSFFPGTAVFNVLRERADDEGKLLLSLESALVIGTKLSVNLVDSCSPGFVAHFEPMKNV